MREASLVNLEKKAAELKSWVKQSGGNFPTRNGKTQAELSLANFIINVRQQYRKKNLPPTIIKKLEAIPGWFWRGSHDEEFLKNLIALSEFVSKNNRYPSQLVEKEFKLFAFWANTLQQYRKGKLSDERQGLVKKHLKVSLEETHKADWDAQFTQLKDFLKLHKKFPDPASKIRSEITLYNWTIKQMHLYGEGRLDKSKIKKLASLPNWSWK